ncbi:hypothetical protein DFQ26_002202 [Actinomortierella ambigua]|nr:hypothetical protein DFQ26_002202 [Actinomortierella ambigua]
MLAGCFNTHYTLIRSSIDQQCEYQCCTLDTNELHDRFQGFGTLEFGRPQEIIDVGHEYGKAMLAKWEKQGRLELLLATEKVQQRAAKRVRRNSI